MKLKVGVVAREQGVRIVDLERRTGMNRSAIRRYWFGAVDGIANTKKPLQRVNLADLQRIATALDVSVADLLETE